jgi:hypothetical protein
MEKDEVSDDLGGILESLGNPPPCSCELSTGFWRGCRTITGDKGADDGGGGGQLKSARDSEAVAFGCRPARAERRCGERVWS